MNFEAWKFSENEKKLKKNQEKKEIKEFLDKQKTHEVTKKQIETQMLTEDKLEELRLLVEKWLLTQKQAEQIATNHELNNSDIQEIFEKITEIEDIQDIDSYLPKELRVTVTEYQKAMFDDIFRIQTLTKIKTALTVLWSQSGITNQAGINLFSWFLSVLDKNLVLIQEHNIDMKNNLEDIENKKNPKEKKSFWQEVIDIFKEIFLWKN